MLNSLKIFCFREIIHFFADICIADSNWRAELCGFFETLQCHFFFANMQISIVSDRVIQFVCVFDDYGLANALFPVNNLYRLHRYAFTRNHGSYFFRVIKWRIVYFKRINNSEKDDSNKKTIARIIRQITGDYDYLERNQCFR